MTKSHRKTHRDKRKRRNSGEASPSIRWPAAVAALGLLIAAFIPLRFALGSLYAFQGAAFLDNWQSGRIPERHSWHTAHSGMDRALTFEPANPEYLQKMGRVLEWQIYQADEQHLSRADLRRILDNAQKYFVRSLEERPTWAFAWQDVARIYSRFGEFEEPFDTALTTAYDLAPWDMNNLTGIAAIGLYAWHHLSPEQQALIVHIGELAVIDPRLGRNFYPLAVEHNRLGIICTRLTYTEEMMAFCSRQ